MIFGFVDVPMTPTKPIYYSSLETPEYSKEFKESPASFSENMIWEESQHLGNTKVRKAQKRRVLTVLKIRLTIFLKILNRGSISSEEHENGNLINSIKRS